MPRGKISVSKKDKPAQDAVQASKTNNFTLVTPVESEEDLEIENGILATDEKPVSHEGVFTIILIAVFIAVNIALVVLLNNDKKPDSIVAPDVIVQKEKPEVAVKEPAKPVIAEQPKPPAKPETAKTPQQPVVATPVAAPAPVKPVINVTEPAKPVVKPVVVTPKPPKDLLSIISKE